MIEKLTAIWDGLTGKERKYVAIGGMLLVIFLVMYGMVKTRNPDQYKIEKAPELKTISLDPKLFQNSLLINVNKENKKQQDEIDGLKLDFKKASDALKAMSSTKNQVKSNSQGRAVNSTGNPPAYRGNNTAGGSQPKYIQAPNRSLSMNKPAAKQYYWVGGIEHMKENFTQESEIKKKEQEQGSIYLPSNTIISATTISGMDGRISSEGKSNPQPMLLRINKSAILPNHMKLNLKDCFVSVEGFADLSSERVNLRTQTLSCTDMDNQSVIDQPIEGYVVDADGKSGLSGRVVAKLGSIMTYTLLAKFVEGLGDGASQVSSVTSATGTVSQTANESEVLRSSLGKGVAASSGELSDFYLKLAEQSMPVIELLSGKKVTIIIQKGSKLIMKNL